MSTTKTYTVWCDKPGCYAWTVASGTADTAAVVRREAKSEGWGRRDGKDFCRAHFGAARPARRPTSDWSA